MVAMGRLPNADLCVPLLISAALLLAHVSIRPTQNVEAVLTHLLPQLLVKCILHTAVPGLAVQI